ncbi:MAG: dihydroneopterin aldolase [Acidobacteriota bacterium]
MDDRVFVQGLEIDCVIGVAEWERTRPQRLRLDLEVEADLRDAAASDDVAGAVDYAAVAVLVREVATASPHRLAETLAESVARAILERFSVASAVRVRVTKPRAVPGTAAVGVEIARYRGENRR